MPKSFKDWKKETGAEFTDIEKQLLGDAQNSLVKATFNAIAVGEFQMNQDGMNLYTAISNLKTMYSYSDEEEDIKINEAKLSKNLGTITGFAEKLKDKNYMKSFAKSVNADTNAPIMGGDCFQLTNVFKIMNKNFDANIDVKGITNLYNECREELFEDAYKEQQKQKEKEERIKNKKGIFKELEELDNIKIDDIDGENKIEEDVEKKATEEEMKAIIGGEIEHFNGIAEPGKKNEAADKKEEKPLIINENIIDKEAVESRTIYEHSQAISDSERIKTDLYAKHNNDGFFRVGGASKELRELRAAHYTYETYMRNINDEKVKGRNEFSFLKDISQKAEHYRAEKRAHGKGDTSAPNWKPKTKMGQIRYAAAGASANFAKERMRQIIKDYSREKGVTLREALEHFDPKSELNLFPKKMVNLDDKIKEAQQKLTSLKAKCAEGEFPSKTDMQFAVSEIAAAYLIKAVNSSKKIAATEVKESEFEDKAKYILNSNEFKEITDNTSEEELYNRGTREKGQDIWTKLNDVRKEHKKNKEIKNDFKNKSIIKNDNKDLEANGTNILGNKTTAVNKMNK